MDVYQLIYQSQSLVPFQAPELLALLQHARGYNQAQHITGILLYTPDGRFLQILEGSQPAVSQLYHQRICPDPRHFNCQVFSEGWSPGRSFAEWAMAFRLAQAHHLRTLLSYVPPNNPALHVPRPHTRPELVALLQGFMAGGETESLPEPRR